MGVKFGSCTVNHQILWTVSRHSLSARGASSPHPYFPAAPWGGQGGCRQAILFILKHRDKQTPWHGPYVWEKMCQNAWISEIFCSHTVLPIQARSCCLVAFNQHFIHLKDNITLWFPESFPETLHTTHPCQHIQLPADSSFHPHNLHP